MKWILVIVMSIVSTSGNINEKTYIVDYYSIEDELECIQQQYILQEKFDNAHVEVYCRTYDPRPVYRYVLILSTASFASERRYLIDFYGTLEACKEDLELFKQNITLQENEYLTCQSPE